jgi:CBS domain-containing protein
MKVEDIMVESVITVDADATVMKAAKLMNKHEIGCLIVTRRGKAAGIITERDVLTRIVAKSKNPSRIKVCEIMSKPLIAGHIDMELEDATHLMFEKQVKKLPIVTQGKLVGLITLTDVARFQPQMIRMLKKLTSLSTTNVAVPKRLTKVMNYYVI